MPAKGHEENQQRDNLAVFQMTQPLA